MGYYKERSALDSLLRLLTDGNNGAERWEFARFTVKASEHFSEDFASTLKRLGATREEFEGEITAILSLRLFWRLIPKQLFTAVDPDYERMAEKVLERELKGRQPAIRIDALGLIYRRMRDAHHHGRPKTSLDLSLSAHRTLLASQVGRCALCRYRFPEHVRQGMFDDEDEETEDSYEALPGEVILAKYYRKPVLDHILPVFLGGDDLENWQILCASCNLGKGEAIAWLFRRGWLPPNRIGDVLRLTPSMRFAGLAAAKDLPAAEDRLDGKVVRLYRRDEGRLLYVDNLVARYH